MASGTRGATGILGYPGDDLAVVVPAPGDGPGNWSGAASATAHGGRTYLAWRERRPLTEGRGVAVRVAVTDDGVSVTELARIERDAFGAESFERPALAFLPDGRVRLYLSCATPGSKHWWIDSLTADRVEDLAGGERAVVLPGDDTVGVKDPVVWRQDDRWWLLACCHPLDEPGQEDRMTTRLAVSDDGISFTDRGEVLAPTPGEWDARGARATAVLPGTGGPGVLPDVVYDGRHDAAANWFETTGAARWDGERYRPVRRLWWSSLTPAQQPSPDGLVDAALRYASAVPTADGVRWYAEQARPDGAHDLVTWTAATPTPPG